MNKKGAIMFAHNNEQIDYLLIAIINSLMVKKNLGLRTQLISDEATWKYGKEKYGELLNVFEYISLVDIDYAFYNRNQRNYRDTESNVQTLPFYNKGRYQAYDFTHYDETLLLDADYLILSDRLGLCFGSDQSVMMNNRFSEVLHFRNTLETTIDPFSIPLWWATAVYFKKDAFADRFFKKIKDVHENFDYYSNLYSFPRNMFRNDYAFSIACHHMNANTSNKIVSDLPNPIILKSTDFDDIHSVGENEITFLAKSDKSYLMSKVKDVDVHVMNKWALVRHAGKLLEIYG